MLLYHISYQLSITVTKHNSILSKQYRLPYQADSATLCRMNLFEPEYAKLNPRHIAEFKALYKARFGVDLSDVEALAKAQSVIAILKYQGNNAWYQLQRWKGMYYLGQLARRLLPEDRIYRQKAIRGCGACTQPDSTLSSFSGINGVCRL